MMSISGIVFPLKQQACGTTWQSGIDMDVNPLSTAVMLHLGSEEFDSKAYHE